MHCGPASRVNKAIVNDSDQRTSFESFLNSSVPATFSSWKRAASVEVTTAPAEAAICRPSFQFFFFLYKIINPNDDFFFRINFQLVTVSSVGNFFLEKSGFYCRNYPAKRINSLKILFSLVFHFFCE